MIVTTAQLFKHAYGKYAIGAYNINNAEQAMGLFRGAIESKAPFIIQICKGARSYTDKRMLEAIIRAAGDIFPEAIFAVHLMGASSIMGAINIVTTILNLRARGMTLMRMPMFCWTSLAANMLIVAAFPILTATLTMLTLDRYGERSTAFDKIISATHDHKMLAVSDRIVWIKGTARPSSILLRKRRM